MPLPTSATPSAASSAISSLDPPLTALNNHGGGGGGSGNSNTTASTLPDSVKQLADSPALAGGDPSLAPQSGLIFVSPSMLNLLGINPSDPHLWWDGVTTAGSQGDPQTQPTPINAGIFGAALTITGNPLSVSYAHTLGTLTYPEYALSSDDALIGSKDMTLADNAQR
jgi:hypothetical protein